MDQNPDGISVSTKKVEANRRNAQRSTGPRTEAGKSQSRRNALKHGMLASAVLFIQRDRGEGTAEFEELLNGLHRDLAPVGALEELLVEKIAVCSWRKKRALMCEAGLVRRNSVGPSRELRDLLHHRAPGTGPEQAASKDYHSLPLGPSVVSRKYVSKVGRSSGEWNRR